MATDYVSENALYLNFLCVTIVLIYFCSTQCIVLMSWELKMLII